MIFECLVRGESELYTLEALKEENNGNLPPYIERVYSGVVERQAELSQLINAYASSIGGRIFAADKAALLLAVYEMLYEKDIPTAVSCNEAVELVKQFSTKASPSYVNGILAAIAKDSEKS